VDTNLARICHLYYVEGLTQQQIAARLHLSRIKVSRLIQQARSTGVVKIEIKYDGFFPQLEQELQARYGAQFIVCDSLSGNGRDLSDSLGSAAAEYLSRILKPRDVVTVGWGTTMRSVATHMSCEERAVTFVPVVGGLANVGLDIHANQVAATMAENTGGHSEALFAPAVAESASARDVLLASRPVARVLDAAAHAPIAVFSLGAPFSPSSSLMMVGYYSPNDIETLRQAGAACDVISAAYYTSSGERCAEDISSRSVSITLEQLRDIPHKICVAGGTDKHEAIRIALELGTLIDVLVLDDQTAKYLLQARHKASRP
jgi:DNA-binding transcriptional regulator LsrR (DeoR family)